MIVFILLVEKNIQILTESDSGDFYYDVDGNGKIIILQRIKKSMDDCMDWVVRMYKDGKINPRH